MIQNVLSQYAKGKKIVYLIFCELFRMDALSCRIENQQ